MPIEKTTVLKLLAKADAIYVANFNDEFGYSANLIEKMFQYGDFSKPLNLGIVAFGEFEEKCFVVGEGAQKLIAISLVLYALCECYKLTNSTNEEAISKIYEKYLIGKFGAKLQLNGLNKKIYEKIIFKEKLSAEEKQNSLFVVLHEFWSQIKLKEIFANELFQLLKSVECYPVEINHDESIDFYYSINKNSKTLDSTKLIRSYLNKTESGLLYLWDEIVDSFKNEDIYKMFSQFLRDFLSIQNTRANVTLNEVYPFFKMYFEDAKEKSSPEKVLNNIKLFALKYVQMLKADFEFFDIKKHFLRLNEVGGQVAYPYLLEVLLDYDNGIITIDMLNTILKTVYKFLKSGEVIDFTKLSEQISQTLIEKNK